MITTIQLVTILYKALNTDAYIKNAITGEVYKDWRPATSALEDIVVNAVVMDGSESVIQRAVANVNLHLPSIITQGGAMPDNGRFETLSQIITPVLEDGTAENYNWWIENTATIKEQNKDQWYLNFRIRFKYHNTNN